MCTLPSPSVGWDWRCEQAELKKMMLKKSMHPWAVLTQLLNLSKFLHGNTYSVIQIQHFKQICLCGLLICRAIQVADWPHREDGGGVSLTKTGCISASPHSRAAAHTRISRCSWLNVSYSLFDCCYICVVRCLKTVPCCSKPYLVLYQQ